MTINNLDNKVSNKAGVTPEFKELRQAIIDAKNNDFITKSERDVLLKNIEKNKELSEMKVKKYLCRGTSAVVFETSDGDVLKITEGSHYPLGRKQESFDVPVLQKGKAGKLRYYIEKKLSQHDMPVEFIEVIKEEIKKKGYKPYDLDSWDLHQIGMTENGELYLLDPECARHKSIFHALWHWLKKRN